MCTRNRFQSRQSLDHKRANKSFNWESPPPHHYHPPTTPKTTRPVSWLALSLNGTSSASIQSQATECVFVVRPWPLLYIYVQLIIINIICGSLVVCVFRNCHPFVSLPPPPSPPPSLLLLYGRPRRTTTTIIH